MLSIEQIKPILDDLRELGGKTVEFSGGEPMAHPDLYEAVLYAKQLSLETELFTSGYYKDTEFNDELIPHLDKVYLNIQGPTSEIHDYLTRIDGSFSSVIDLGKHLVANGLWVGTHIIPFSFNLEGIDEYIELAKFHGFNNVSLLRFVEQGRGREMDSQLMLNETEILTLHEIIQEYKPLQEIEFKHGCPIDFQFLFSDDYSVLPCLSGICRAVIKVNGNVLPCPAFKDVKEFIAGNILESSLRDIWVNSKVFKLFRELDYSNITGRCGECRHLRLCHGRCPAQRFHFHGDVLHGPDPYCPLFIENNFRHN
jgi:pyrroloquinoline quinone biosynthesis protein E